MLTRSVCLLCTSVLVFLVGVASPLYNWDMIGYVAAAYKADGYRGAELSKRTYEAVRAEVGGARFAQLTDEGGYVEAVFRSPASLEEQVPFYSVRVVYVEMMRALKAVGVGYPNATYLISAFFAALSVLLLGAVIFSAQLPLPVLPVAVIASGYGHLAQLSTPDALAGFFSLWALYCLLTNNKLVFVLSAVLPLMRTDAILLSALLIACAFWRGNRSLSCASLAVSVAAYLLVNRWFGAYGLLVVFNFYFMKMAPFPAEMPISHNLPDYLLPYLLNLRDLLVAPDPQALIYLLCFYVLLRYRSEAKRFPGLDVFLIIPLSFIALRMLAFPNYEDRFFVIPTSMMLVWTLGVLENALKARASR